MMRLRSDRGIAGRRALTEAYGLTEAAPCEPTVMGHGAAATEAAGSGWHAAGGEGGDGAPWVAWKRRHGAQQHACLTHPLPDMPGARLQALQRVLDLCLAEQKLRFLCAANADRKGGRTSTGVRGWLMNCVSTG